jgi:recombination protein RecA
MQTQTMTPDARERAVHEAVGRIEKMFGKGALMRMDGDGIGNVPVISSGCLGIDLALGVGGIPRGRVTEIYGPESSGKTTLALHLIAEAQRAGGACAFVDAEHALDVTYASKLGVDVPALLVSQPDSGEQALEITDTLVRSGGIDLVVVDSVAALTPRSEIEGDMGDNHVGLHARLMSQAMRKLTSGAARTGTSIVFINQLRMKIGVTFGSPEVTTGGQALKFYSTVRIDIRRIGAIKHGDEMVGNRTRVKVVKNKVAPPFRFAEVEIRFGVGICPWLDLLDRALTLGLVSRSGSWLTWGEVRVQGRDSMRSWMLENRDEAEKLKLAVLERLGLVTAPEVAEA